MHVAPSARTGLKAAVAAAGAVGLLSTGVAFAASGHAPWSHASAAPAESTSTDAADPTHPTHPAHPSGGPSDGSSHSTGPNAHGYVGLCRAYTVGKKSEHGGALESPAFVALVTAAGGEDNVEAFCGTVTQGHSGSHPTHPAHPTQAVTPTHPAHPTHPAEPTQATSPTHPTQAVTPTHPAQPTPTHQPTDKPSHTPKPHPTH
jgi:hypothetical protein